jgi:hypothetical protein
MAASTTPSPSLTPSTKFSFQFTPNNIFTILSFFSPYVLITFFTLMSFYFGSYQGLVYLGFTIFSLLIRWVIYLKKPQANEDTSEDICNVVEYFGTKMPSFISIWLFSHTIGYILVPILSSITNTYFMAVRIFNIGILIFLFAYMALDMHIKNKIGNCFKEKPQNLLINVGVSFMLSLIFSLGMTYSGNETARSLIYFNDIMSYTGSSPTSHCARVTPTKFKCTV